MLMYTAHRTVFRCLSLMTLMAFFPTSVQAWQFMPLVGVSVPVEDIEQNGGLIAISDHRLAELSGKGLEGTSVLSLIDQDRLRTLAQPELREKMQGAEPELPLLADASLDASAAAAASYQLSSGVLGRLPAGPIENTESIKQRVASFAGLPRVDVQSLMAGRDTEQNKGRVSELLAARQQVIVVGEPREKLERRGPFVIRRSQPEQQQTNEASGTEGEPRKTVELTLLSADEKLNSGDVAGAALDYLQLIDGAPGSADARLAEETLSTLAEDAENGLIDLAELEAFLRAMPVASELHSAEGRYFLAEACKLAGILLSDAGDQGRGGDFLLESRDISLALARDYPTHAYNIFSVRNYVDVCRRLGKEPYDGAISELRAIIRSEESYSILLLAARSELALHYKTNYTPEEAIFHFANLLEEFGTSSYQGMLDDPIFPENCKVRMEMLAGLAHFNLNERQAAVERFDGILSRYEVKGRDVELASYYKAISEFFLARQDPATGIRAFEEDLSRFPHGHYSDQSLWMIGNIYLRAEDFATANEVYSEVLEYFPSTEFRDAIDRATAYGNEELRIRAIREREAAQKHVLQSRGEDAKLWCGPYALSALLEQEGIQANVAEIAVQAATDEQGTTLLGLQQAASEYGVPLSGIWEVDINKLATPFIGLLDGDHFVCVKHSDHGEVVLFDSNYGYHTLTRDAFAARWIGIALVNDSMQLAALGDAEMNVIVGGTGSDPLPSDLSDTTPMCTNSHCRECPGKKCDLEGPGGHGGGPQGPGGNGSGVQCFTAPCPSAGPGLPPGIGNDSGKCGSPEPTPSPPVPPNCPGCPISLNPSSLTRIDSNSPGINGYFNIFQSAQQFDETDIAVPVRGSLRLSFSRMYHNPFGIHYEASSQPYHNNIGWGWSHSYNTHLRVSELFGTVAYIDPRGNAIAFTKDSSSGGFDHYSKASGGLNNSALAWTLKRDTSSGKFFLQFPSGTLIEYSEPLDEDERYCRPVKITDGETNEVNLDYNDSLDAPFGKLTKVFAPGADDRYLQFSYHLTHKKMIFARLMEDGNVKKHIDYEYDGAYLTKVTVNGNTDVDIKYKYEESVDGAFTGRYISSVTDRAGIETTFDYDYAISSGKRMPTKVTVGYDSGLETTYTRTAWPSIQNRTVVENWDGATRLSKYETDSKYDSDNIGVDYFRFYPDPNDTPYQQWSYAYTSEVALTNITAPGGITWSSYSYNDVGRLSTSGKSGRIGTLDYPSPDALFPDGYIASNGTKTYYYYDSKNRMTRIAHPSTSASDPPGAADGVKYAFDAYSQITKTTNQFGNSWYYEYDDRGNMITMIGPDDNPTTPTHPTIYEYDVFGSATKITDPLGNVTEYEYAEEGCGGCGGGPAGRGLVKVTDPELNETEFEHDVNGRVTKSIDALNRETTYTYDTMGRTITVTSPGNTVSTMAYNLMGRLTKTTGPDGKETTYAYDHFGRTTKVTDAIGDTAYAFDALGRMTTVTDSNGNTTTYGYNNKNDLTSVTDAEGKKTHYEYDAIGRLTRTAAGASSTVDPVEYFFHPDTGIMTRVKYTNNGLTNEAEYYYDLGGRLTQIDDWMGGAGNDGHFFEYDENNRLTRYRDFDDDPGGARNTLDYVYDDAGRVLTMTDYEDYETYYTYTDRGQVSTITAPGNKVWDFNYNAIGQRTQYSHPNGMNTVYGYDNQNRLTKIDHNDGDVSPTTLEGWEYSLADDGNILRMANLTDSGGWDYGYDGRDRLIDAVRLDADGLPQLRMAYAYDDGDNMLTKETIVYEEFLYDDFSDGNYSADPTWTIASGTWTAAAGHMSKTAGTGSNAFSRVHTESDNELWFSYRVDDPSDHMRAFSRFRYSSNGAVYLSIEDDKLEIREYLFGGTTVIRDTNTSATSTVGDWYDVRIVTNGAHMEVWRAEQGDPMVKVLETDAVVVNATNAQVFQVYNGGRFSIDDIRLVKADTTDGSIADDFDDGGYTPEWTVGGGTWSASGDVMASTSVTAWTRFFRTADYADATLSYSYRIIDTGLNTNRAAAYLRYDTGTTDSLILYARPDKMQIDQTISSTTTTLDTNTAFTSTEDQWYDVHVVLDGSQVDVWRGESGEAPEHVFTVNTDLLTSNNLRFADTKGFAVEYDNINLAAEGSTTTVFEYNDANEMTKTTQDGATVTNYTYDEWGRTVTKAQGAYEAVYQYRYGQMLKRVDTDFPGETDVSFIYDGMNKRRFRSVDPDGAGTVTWWRYDRGWNILAEYEDDAGAFWDIGDRATTYTGKLAKVDGTNPSTGSYEYHASDHLGSIRRVYDASKDPLATYEYSPYGQAVRAEGQELDLGYTGHRWDASIGQYWAPYRFYSPSTSRWLARDPIGIKGGSNLYGYAGASPINSIDLLGLSYSNASSAALQSCYGAPPIDTDKSCGKPCDIYSKSEEFAGLSAKCVCENAGNSAWDKSVRGCLACAKMKGVNAHDAHMGCYGAANDKHGYWRGKRAQAAIALFVTPICFRPIDDGMPGKY